MLLDASMVAELWQTSHVHVPIIIYFMPLRHMNSSISLCILQKKTIMRDVFMSSLNHIWPYVDRG